MMKNSRDLISELAKARQNLTDAELRVTELETALHSTENTAPKPSFFTTFLTRFDVRVSAVYGSVATLWILFSDQLLAILMTTDLKLSTEFSLLKGLAFVWLTTLILFFLLYTELRKRKRIEQVLERDLIQRKQAEESVKKLNRTLSVLSDINQAIVRIRHIPTLFEEVCKIAVEKGAFRMAWVGLLDVQTSQVKPVAQAGMAEEYVNKLDISLNSGPATNGPTATAIKSGKRVVVNDIEHDRIMEPLPWRDDAIRLVYRSSIALPLVVKGEARGIYHLYSDVTDFFDEPELRLMDEMAGDLSFAMEFAEKEAQRERDEQQIKRLYRTLSVLSDINQAIVRTRNIQTLFEEACGIAVEKGAFRMAWIGLLDSQTTQVKPVAQAGFAEDYLDKLNISLDDEVRGRGPTGNALRSSQPVIVNDVQADPQMQPWRETAQRLGYNATAALPLIVSGEARGILAFYADETGFFDEQEVKLVVEMAGDISFAMEFAEQEAQHKQAQAALLESESRYHRTLDNLLEGAEIIGFDWHYLYLNDASAVHGRQPKEALLGSTVLEMYPEIENSEMFAYLQTSMENRIPQHFENEFTFPDGTKTWFELRVQPIPEGIFILSLDITERKRSEITLQRYARRMEVLHEIDKGIINSKSIQSIVEVALKQVRKIIPCQRVSLMLLDEKTNEWLIFVADTNLNTPLGSGTRIPNLSTPSEQFRVGRIAVTDDLRLLPEPSPAIQQLINEGLLSSLHARFVVANQSLGSLNLFADSTNYFLSDHQEIAAEIADQLAIAIKQMRLSDEIAHHAAELEQHNIDLTQAKAKLERYAKRMEVLHEIDKGLIQGSSIQLLVQATLNHVRQLIPCQQANVTIVDHATHEGLIFALDLNGDTFFTQGVRSPLPPDVFEGYDENHIRIFEDIRLLQDTSPRAKQLVSEGMLSLLSALLMDQNNPIGSLVLVADTSGFFTAEHQEIAKEIASQLAIAIRQMRLSDKILQSEGQYRLLAENMADVVWILDTAALRFSYVSPSVQQLRGYTPEEVLNQTIAEALTPASLQMIVDSLPERIEAFVVGDPQAISQAYEVEQVCKDGSTVWTEVVTTLLQDGNGALQILGVTRNIAGRKQAEAELREREEWIRLSMEATDLGKWRYDIEKGILNFDERARKHYGFEHHTVAVDEVLTHIHPEDVERFKRELAITLDPAGNSKSAMEYRILLPDGTERWLSALAHIYFEGQGSTRHAVYGFGTSQDITERKQAEVALRKAEAQERAMLSAIPDLIFRYDADGKFLDYHAPDSAVLAAPPEAFLGKKAHDVLPPELADSLLQRIQQVISTKQPTQFEYILPGTSGIGEFEARLVPVSENEVLVIVRDVTERKLAERELQSLYNATSYLFKADNVLSLGQQIVAAVVREFEHADCGIVLLDKSKNKIIRLARTGQADLHPETPLTLDGSGLIPQALREGEVIYEPDVSQNSYYVPSEVSTLSEFVIPLKTSNGIIGALDLQHAEKNAFTDRDRRILSAYAERAAPAIEIMQLYDELNHYAVELESRVAQRTAELNHAKERAEAILNHSIDGIVLMDSQLAIQQTNLAFDALFDVEPDAYFEKSFADLLSVQDAEAVQKMMIDRQGQRLEIMAHRKNGTVFDAEFGFGFIKNDGIVCIIHDITKRKRAEKAIAEERNLLRTLIDALPDYIYVKDTQHRTLLSNLARTRSFGLTSPEETIGKDDYAFVPAEMAVQYHADEDRLFQTLEPLIDREERTIGPQGNVIWASTTKVPLRNLNDELIGLVGITHDVSEIKATEEALRQSEKQLRESQKMLRLVLDTIPVRVFWKNRDSVVVGCNRLFARDAGFDSADDLLATSPNHLQAQTAEEKKFRADEIVIMKTGIPKLDYEETLTVSGHESLTVQTSKLPLRNEEGDVIGILGVYTDISERKVQERQLRYFASLQESVVDAVIVTDVALHIQTWNQGAERIYGWTADEVIGKFAPDLLHIRRSSTEDMESLGQRLIAQGFVQQETIQQHKDGRDIFILGSATLLTDEKGIPVGVISVNRDISERKDAERQLRFDAAIQESISDAVIVTNTEFRIQSWNKAAESIYGWTASEAIGKTAEILQTHFESDEERNQSITGLFSEGQWRDEYIQRRKDGSELYVLSSTSVLKDENDVPIGVIAVNRDITERKHAEEALRQSEQLIRTVLNIMPVGVWILDEKGTITFGNSAGQQIWAGVQYVGRENYDVFKAWRMDTGKLVEPHEWSASRAITSGEHVLNDELEIEVFDGRHKFMLDSAVPLRNNAQRIIGAVVINQDITGRKQIEQALRESENRFRSLIEAAPIATVITNDQGQITLINKQLEYIFGYTPEEILGQPVEMLIPASFRSIHPSYRASYMEQPSVRRMSKAKEFHALRKDGTEFPAEIELSYVKTVNGMLVMSFVMDITERKKAEQALRESETRYRLLAENITDIISRVTLDGIYKDVSPSSAAVLGYTSEDMIGKPTTDFIHPDDKAALQQKQQNAPDQQSEFPFAYRFRHRNGYYIWLEVARKLITSKDSDAVQEYVMSARDITVRKRAEEALKNALEKEKELNELKTRFVSTASHEFRTPLATILAVVETLLAYRRRLKDEEIDDKLSKITDQVTYLKTITEDMLQIVRLQDSKTKYAPASLNLDALSRSVIDEFESRADVTHKFVYSCDDSLQRVSLDPKLMRQIVSNLVSNAVKYSPPNKTITISLQRIEASLILKIQDEGIGIPEADLRHLFEPFHRATNVGTIPGTGLGLVITKESVELHGGSITVDSQLGIGTTFTITIPLADEKGGQHEENSAH